MIPVGNFSETGKSPEKLSQEKPFATARRKSEPALGAL